MFGVGFVVGTCGSDARPFAANGVPGGFDEFAPPPPILSDDGSGTPGGALRCGG